MGAFEYTALDAQGRERKGLIEGDTAKHVRQMLRDKQLLPMDIQETAQKYLHPDALDLIAVANQSVAKINTAALSPQTTAQQ